ncbi:MAG: hypothetical protein FWH44_06125 [Methanomassiliicoccaceae archaeon]|nr:hypothetical protein [Methanomassiliicoccaceae archaeon]
MTENVMNREALSEMLFRRFRTENFRVTEKNGVIHITPEKENYGCMTGLRGILADHPELSVDNFLKMKHAEKELEP